MTTSTIPPFNLLPLLLRRRHVIGCGLRESHLRWFKETELRTIRPHGLYGCRLYLKADVAKMVGKVVDWSEFEGWPALLRRTHLLALGMHDPDIAALISRQELRAITGHGATKYYKAEVAMMVGHPEARIETT